MSLLMPRAALVTGVSIASLLFLALLDAISARAGGAKVATATLRVTPLERLGHGSDGGYWRDLQPVV